PLDCCVCHAHAHSHPVLLSLLFLPRPPSSTLFPYTTLFRSLVNSRVFVEHGLHLGRTDPVTVGQDRPVITGRKVQPSLTIHDSGVTRQIEGAVRGETHLRCALVVHIAVEPGQGALRQIDPYPSVDTQRGRFVIDSLQHPQTPSRQGRTDHTGFHQPSGPLDLVDTVGETRTPPQLRLPVVVTHRHTEQVQIGRASW